MTRADAKRRAVEMWGEMGVIGRATAVLVLVGLLWAGVSGFKNAIETWVLPIRVYLADRHNDQLRYVRDSVASAARHDELRRGQKYTDCLILTRGRTKSCEHLKP